MSAPRPGAVPEIVSLTSEETERFASFFPDGMDDPEWPDYSLRLAKLKDRGVSLAEVGVVLEATPRYGPAWNHERHAEKEFFLQRERQLRTLLKECQAEVRWRFMLDEAPLHLEDGPVQPCFERGLVR